MQIVGFPMRRHIFEVAIKIWSKILDVKSLLPAIFEHTKKNSNSNIVRFVYFKNLSVNLMPSYHL